MESLPQLIINSTGLNFRSDCYSDYNSVPFLQMLQGEDTVMPETNMELLLRLRQQRQWARNAEQYHSCVTQKSAAAPRERKKRKRTRPATTTKKVEEVESQRLTHIAVERNRRRLMNEHLAALRDLMPPSFVRRGDQASIVGGAIEFVKELEQHLVSLEAEKRMRTAAFTATSSSNEEEAGHSAAPPDEYVFDTLQQMSYSRSQQQRRNEEGVDVEATVVQAHASVRVTAPQRAGQLARAVAALEELHLSVQHLNVTALDEVSILYSLNLKMEDDCQLSSADEIATAVHQIFAYINGF